jgi:membrane associated rhomboid family serine protease
MPELISPERAKGIKRLLWVALACGIMAAVFSVLAAGGGNTPYAITLAVVAALLIASSGFTLRVLPERDVRARRGALTTGVLMLLLALPAVQIWIGLIMAVGGVGMIFVVLSKETEA